MNSIFLFALFVLSQLIFQSAGAQMTRQEKKSWLAQLTPCERKQDSFCRELSLQFITAHKKYNRNSFFITRPQARTTILSLHSFTLDPINSNDNYHFLNRLGNRSDLNILAPVFTAHHLYSTSEDFKQVSARDWFLDTELALRAASALGQRVIIQGFSMGGLMAIYGATHFPHLVDRTILVAPAIMIAKNMDTSACLGKSSFVKYLVKSFSPPTHSNYMDKFLNGACPLSEAIMEVRAPFTSSQNNSHIMEPPQNNFYEKMDEVGALAASIQHKTLFLYSEIDEAVDVYALKKFSESLKSAEVIFYPAAERVSHVYMMYNIEVKSQQSTSFNLMEKFINE